MLGALLVSAALAAAGPSTTVDFGGAVDSAEAVAIQPDGRIVVAGWSSIPRVERVRFALSRHLPDGSLDAGFGRSGRVITGFGTEAMVEDVLLQPDGKIVVAGRGADGIGVARYGPDGSLDPSFGGDGTVVVERPGECLSAEALALAADGSLLLAGSSGCGGERGGMSMAVARLGPGGLLDGSFARDGIRTLDFGRCAFATSVAVQRDAKIVVGGADGGCNEGASPFRVARLNADGSLDAGFGRRHVRFPAPHAVVNDVLLDAQDRVVLVGSAGPREATHGSHRRIALARRTASGAPDRGFSGDGKLTTGVVKGRAALANGAALMPDGRIAVAGAVLSRFGAPAGFAIGVYDDAGRGRVERVRIGRYSEAHDVAVDGQGRIVAVGQTGDRDFAIAFQVGESLRGFAW